MTQITKRQKTLIAIYITFLLGGLITIFYVVSEFSGWFFLLAIPYLIMLYFLKKLIVYRFQENNKMKKKITITQGQLLNAIGHGKGVAFEDEESANEYAQNLKNQMIYSASVKLTKGDRKLIYVIPIGQEKKEDGNFKDLLEEPE